MVATFCIYAQVQDHEFTNYDDDEYITESSLVQSGLTTESVIQVFTTMHFGGWQPITSLSYLLDYELYGLNPTGYFLANLFFHIAGSLFLFLALLRMTGAIWQSAFVAAMFAFHPLNVESVAWISERKNVLSTLFWIMTMWAYIHYAEKPTLKRYGLVFLFFALGLMSKPMLVTLPFALLLLDYWPLRRLRFEQERSRNEILEKNTARRSEFFQLVLEKIPLFLLSMGSSMMTIYSAKTYFQINSLAGSLDLLSLQTRLINAMVSYWSIWERWYGPVDCRYYTPTPEMLYLYGKEYCAAWHWWGLPLFRSGLLERRPMLQLDGFGIWEPWYL